MFNCLGTFILKAIKSGLQIISANIWFVFMISTLLKKKRAQMGEGVEIHPNAYLFRHSIKGTRKRGGKKKAIAAKKFVSSSAPLTLLKWKKLKKLVEVIATNSKESSVNRE